MRRARPAGSRSTPECAHGTDPARRVRQSRAASRRAVRLRSRVAPEASVPPSLRHRRRLGASRPPGGRRRDRPDPGGHLADGLPVGAAARRCSTTGTRTRPPLAGASAVTAPPTPGHGVLVALEGRTPVGFAAFGPAELTAGEHPHPAGPTAELSTLLVEPRWGRRGHGSRLLAAVADLAGAAAPRACRCGCSRPTGRRRTSTSRPAGRPTAGPARWTPAREPLREIRWHALLDDARPREANAVTLRGLSGRGPGLLRGPRGRQLQDLLDPAQGRLRRARPGTAAGAARGGRAGVRDAEGLPARTATCGSATTRRRTRPTRARSCTRTAPATGSWYLADLRRGAAWSPVAAGGWSPTRSRGTAGPSPTPCRVPACRRRSTGWPRPAGASTASSSSGCRRATPPTPSDWSC